MEPEFWQQRWRENRIAFHEGRVNRHLETFWLRVDAREGELVLVPLCGKAFDLAWLRSRGHRVIGVELSERACRAFFAERGIEPTVTEQGPFVRFSHDYIELLCGDFFDLEPGHVHGATLIYDRAALIALPAELRPRYCEHLTRLMGAGTRGLLITLNYPPQDFHGPPFAVDDSEVRGHLSRHFDLQRLHTGPLGPDDPLLARGLVGGSESVYRLDALEH